MIFQLTDLNSTVNEELQLKVYRYADEHTGNSMFGNYLYIYESKC